MKHDFVGSPFFGGRREFALKSHPTMFQVLWMIIKLALTKHRVKLMSLSILIFETFRKIADWTFSYFQSDFTVHLGYN